MGMRGEEKKGGSWGGGKKELQREPVGRARET